MNEIRFKNFLFGNQDNLKEILNIDSFADNGEYIITRQDLIKICDCYLTGLIDSSDIGKIGFDLIISDFFTWDDEVISEIIYDWDNQDICYEINDLNIKLWKDYLHTGISKLPDYNDWKLHIKSQQEICKNNNAVWTPINPKLKIGISDDLTKDPLNGLRHPAEKGTNGWFLWTGDYKTDSGFFEPICAEHLLKIRPEIIKYLGLPAGFRFLIDSKGYEDIWEDKDLLNI
ncbi:MAG: hypothetical protein KBB71_09840 [Lentimicrobiaceae bacterium]|nr:hypothetical protein [Lentimicrobiaceae bacterium]